ncbi:hypothetical protein D6777_01790 [Candidatus Woesearchaeota archaeon]|nr:MAG: hypothetical protein D6777_01790 [Candidatus Woesearchaeota archaeon]
MEVQKRQTAYKFWLKDIMEAESFVNENGALMFKVKGKDVIRVNVLASAIHKYVSESGNYVFVTLDDGSAQTRLKVWNEDTGVLANVEIGDLLLVVGKIGINNNEIFIRPEAVKKIENPDWELVRKLELTKEYGKPEGEKKLVEDEPVVEEVVVSNEPSINLREKVISLIEVSGPDGVNEEELIEKLGEKEDDVTKVVEELLMEGEIYQPKKGFLKLIG